MKITRKISTSGKYSKVINIPREYLKELGWKENQLLELELDIKGKQIIIKDAKKK
jgi:bifunctional DNA-binding transcriptional regulator/antitoxin component of YhaV-PrlF toxin-antitoxin module